MSPEPMEPEGEVSRELRRLWQQESAGAPALPAESLSCTDARTQSAVRWVQAACAEEARRAPAAELPEWVRRREALKRPAWRSRPAQFTYAISALAAAAAAALILQRAPIEAIPKAPTTLVAELNPPVAEPPVTAAFKNAPTSAFQGERSIARPDRVELVKGGVRIVLLQPQREVTVEAAR